MVAFARFVMRDNGLAIHINADQVTQVRQTSEGEPAIYTLGRDTPMIVEGTLEAAIRKLEAATAGIRVVEPAAEPIAETTAPEVKPPVLELVASAPEPEPEPEPVVQPEPEPEVVAAAKTRTVKAKSPAKVKTAKAKAAKVETADGEPADGEPAKVEDAPAKKQEIPYPTASWFRGNR
jgi:protein TonB